ncbi:MAG: cytochrome c [Pseudomonadota bacterium]
MLKPFLIPLTCAAALSLAACSEDAADTAAPAAEGAASAGEGVAAIMEARHEAFEKLGKTFKTISDQLRSGSPDLSIVQPAAASVPEITKDMETWFPAGSGPESGIKTDALAAIWEKPEEFAAKIAAHKTAAASLGAAAGTGDIGAITAAFKATGATCGSCHDSFKAD